MCGERGVGSEADAGPGPFPYMQLRGWKATGAFGPTCENIELQQVKPREGEGEGSWGRWEEVVDAKP